MTSDFIDILDVYVVPASTTNLLGQVIDGHIQLRGQRVEIAVPNDDVFRRMAHPLLGMFDVDDPEESDDHNYYCLPVAKYLGQIYTPSLHGLVLTPTSAPTGDEYRRVEICSIHLEHRGDGNVYFEPTLHKSTVIIV
jgi:hypothetical protein